jgi:ABC-2 type transport system permease protein
MIRIWEIIKKDFKIIVSDRKALFVILAMPLLLTGILSMALGGSFEASGKEMAIPVALVIEDDAELDQERFLSLLNSGPMKASMTQETRQDLEEAVRGLNPTAIFQEDFLGSEGIRDLVELSVMDREGAEAALDATEVHAVIVLPKHFTYDMYMNYFTPFRNRIEVEVLGHTDYQYSLRIMKEVVNGFFQVINTGIIEKNVLLSVGSLAGQSEAVYENMDEIITGFEGSVENIQIQALWGTERIHIDSFTYYAAAMLAMFVLFTAGFGSRSLLREKRDHTASRMQSAGASLLEMMVGKWVMMVGLTVCQMVILFIVSRFAFGVRWTSPIGLLITSLAVGIAIASLGTLISLISYHSNNYKVANLFESVIVQIMALLGGSYIPLGMLPKGFSLLAPFTINGLTLRAILTLQRGFGFQSVLWIWAALLGVSGVLLLLVFGLSRWKGGILNGNHSMA